jgi:protein-tyrosine phosphatase
VRNILFICTANICRSPTAEGVMRRVLAKYGLESKIKIDSAGTHDYHLGKPPFFTAVEAAKRRGYDITGRVSRRVGQRDFEDYDLILAMDKSHLQSLRSIVPTRYKEKIELLLDYSDKYHGQEVPDPFGGTEEDFERALDMIEDGCKGLGRVLKSLA